MAHRFPRPERRDYSAAATEPRPFPEDRSILNARCGTPTILAIEDLTLRFGGVTALSGLTLEAREGELLAIVGPNGAGKTSVLNCVSGLYRPQRGSITLYDHAGVGRALQGLPPDRIARLGVGRTFQNIELFKHMTVLDNITLGRHVHMSGGVLRGGLCFGRHRGTEIEHRRKAEWVIGFLELESVRRATVGNLPYGKQKLVELARALALEPRILLLDEPMAGMNAEEKESMARFILDVQEEWDVTPVVIDHDMDVIMDIADRVVVVDFGRVLAEGPPEQIRSDPRVIDAYLGDANPRGPA